MDNTELSNFRELEKPPTLVAESAGSEKISGEEEGDPDTRVNMASGEDKSAKMPVLQPNVGIATRTKSGRIHKPTRNFNSDEYVVPTLVKRRIPNNSRPHVLREKGPVPPTLSSAGNSAEMDLIRSRLEEKFPKALVADDEETPFTYIISVCFKERERVQNMSVHEIHTKVKNTYKTWAKGPFRLREDEVKFVYECIVKPEWSRISMKEWRILAEALKDRMARMRKRFSRAGRVVARKRRDDLRNTFMDLGNKIVKGAQLAKRDEEDLTSDEMEHDEDFNMEIDTSSTHSSRISTRSKEPSTSKGRGETSKTSSITNDDFDLSLGSVGIEDIAEDELKEEMFDDLESALVNESSSKSGGNSNSMVAALHATLHSGGIDPSQYQPPALEKDSSMFALDDMEGTENFFETMDEPTFGDDGDGTPTGEMTDEAFAELEGRAMDDDVKPYLDENFAEDQQGTSSGRRYVRGIQEKLDLGALEIEESSGNVRPSGMGGDMVNPGVTMISTKTALMCALKISEDFLPTSHETYLDRLEQTEKYRQDELNDIRRKFNMKISPSKLSVKRKLNVEPMDSNKKPKVVLKPFNGSERPKAGMPYLRSAYARNRKFMEDETTVIEKLGNNKILAAGQVIEVDYENYMKESDLKIPFDDDTLESSKLLPPSVSNCHAPSCRLGCICASITEDVPPRKHCGRARCFFECTCQQLLFNNSDDGDIRSRLRPRVSLLNWRAESTEKEKEPMTSYRQMERGTHFFRVRRTAVPSERLRREYVHDGKVVERTAAKVTKVTKERLRTKAHLHQPAHHLHRRFMGKHDPHSHTQKFIRIVPGKMDQKPKQTIEEMKKKTIPMSVNVKLLDVEITAVKPVRPMSQPAPLHKKQPFMTRKEVSPPKMTAKDMEEMKSILQEMTEDCQLLAMDDKIGFFSWAKGIVTPKVTMYQVQRGDEFKVPWLYLPIPPQGYSWICHYVTSSFENTDYVYIPEIQCCISSHALKVNMNTAFVRKKGVVFDVKSTGNAPGLGRIYFFPDLPKILICGPFRTAETTVNPKDEGIVGNVDKALAHMEKLRLMKHFGDDQSWKKFTSSPTIFPIKKRSDNETTLSQEESRKLFAQIYPSLISTAPVNQVNTVSTYKPPVPPKPAFTSWSNAVKFVGFDGGQQKSLTELITIV